MNVPIKGAIEQVDYVPAEGGSETTGDFVELDLAKILRTLRRRLKLILSITIGLTVLAVLAVYQITPRYTGQTLVILDNQKTEVVDIQAVMSGLPADSSTVDSQVEILKSRSIAQRVVDKLHLVDDPEFNAALRPVTVFTWFNPLYWVRELLPASVPLTEAEQQALTLDAVTDAFSGRESISRRGLTYVIEIDFSSESPQKAAAIANAIADTYVLDQLEAKFNATKEANEWLSGRLQDLRQQLQDSERALEIYRSQNGLEDSNGQTVSEQQLSDLNAQLILARADAAEREAKYASAKQILAKGGSIDSIDAVLQSPTISSLRQQEAQLASKQADLSSKYGPRHPAILNIEAQRRDIGAQIGAEVRRIVAGVQNDASVADARVASLQKSLADLQGKNAENNQASIRLHELQRETDANKAVYESFLNRFKETSQQSDLQTPDARVISKSAVPVAPSYPKKSLVVAVAFVLALGLGIGMALLLERLDNRLHTASDIESELGIAHLVSVPAVPRSADKNGSPEDYVLAKPLSSFSEALRSLRSALSLSNVDNPPKIVLFTSALPSEGKTTTATSFARAAAQAGVKTILVDCDLRHPSIRKRFGLTGVHKGLVELLAGQASLEEVSVTDSQSGLNLIPVASGAANPPDLLGSQQMRRLLQQLRDSYDLVVLDSAPVLPVSDASVLSRIADQTVFIARWAQTPREAARLAVRQLRSYDARIAGAVLTVVDTTKQAKYGYGDGGYYYGRYSRYYAN